MLGSDASKLGNGRSKAGSGRLKGDDRGQGGSALRDAVCDGNEVMAGKFAPSGDREGVPVKESSSAGKVVRSPAPASRAMSASPGTLSIDGSDGMEGAGTPNCGCRISVPGMAEA